MDQGGYYYSPPPPGPLPVPPRGSSAESPPAGHQRPALAEYGSAEHAQAPYHTQPHASTSTYPYPHDIAPVPHLPTYPPTSPSPHAYAPPYAGQLQTFQRPHVSPPPQHAPSLLAGFMGVDSAHGSQEDRDEAGRLSNARMPKKPKPRQPAPDGVIVTDKSCARCRVRKVRCNRVFPRCDHCTARCEDCDLKDWKPKPKIKSTDPARVAELEKRLAELEEQLAKGGTAAAAIPADAFDFPSDISEFKTISALSSNPAAPSQSTSAVTPRTSIGPHSLDWRLAEPQMASSLSHHLCEAFWESCCFLLPTYEFFRPRMNEFLPGREDQLTAAQKVALTTFCAVGARTSPHSAVLGISLKPEDTVEHPDTPLLSAGTRRQNACKALFDKAHSENYESGTADAATVENLGTLMALLQLSLFAEIHPSKSRPLLRSAISHYRELQDSAATEDERAWIRGTFGFAIYTVDCSISTYARRKCHIRDEDLQTYFARETRIIVPRLPFDQLLPTLEKVLKAIPEHDKALKTCKHLLACWLCACQRAFVQIVAPSMEPRKPVEERAASIEQLWTAIDATRVAAQYVLSLAPPTSVHTHAPQNGNGGSGEHRSVHEHDYGAQIVRLDRDLLDLINVLHVHIHDTAASDLPPRYVRESTSRVRKALRRRAYYLKSYVTGADVHMTFHELMQLELLPNWTDIALQRVGEHGGPQSIDEEVSERELHWFVEGLQHACYYHPSAEKRLLALAPRLSTFPGRLDLSPRLAPLASPALASPPLAPWVDATASATTPSPVNPLPQSQLSPAPPPLGFSPSLVGGPYAGPVSAAEGGRGGTTLPSPPINFDPLSPLQFGDTGLGGLSFLDQFGGGEGVGSAGASPTWTGGGTGAHAHG
ncbi:hypothetical protein JCM3770_006495 [Rhodotorula araucariae]